MALPGEGPPGFRLGGRGGQVRYRESEVIAWIEERSVDAVDAVAVSATTGFTVPEWLPAPEGADPQPH